MPVDAKPQQARTKRGARLQEEARAQEYAIVKTVDLQEHPDNPRRGHIEAIDESIDINGWYGAVVAQKSTMRILAGNHRYRVAKKRGAREVPAILVDCDDETALRILLADNRTADLGGYDEETLTTLLEGLETLDGTGWGLDQIEADDEPGDAPIDQPVPDDQYEPQFAVVVACANEATQESVYERLAAEYEEVNDVEVRVVAV